MRWCSLVTVVAKVEHFVPGCTASVVYDRRLSEALHLVQADGPRAATEGIPAALLHPPCCQAEGSLTCQRFLTLRAVIMGLAMHT